MSAGAQCLTDTMTKLIKRTPRGMQSSRDYFFAQLIFVEYIISRNKLDKCDCFQRNLIRCAVFYFRLMFY